MTDELWQAFVQVAGAVNALLLGSVLVFSPQKQTSVQSGNGDSFDANNLAEQVEHSAPNRPSVESHLSPESFAG